MHSATFFTASIQPGVLVEYILVLRRELRRENTKIGKCKMQKYRNTEIEKLKNTDIVKSKNREMEKLKKSK